MSLLEELESLDDTFFELQQYKLNKPNFINCFFRAFELKKVFGKSFIQSFYDARKGLLPFIWSIKMTQKELFDQWKFECEKTKNTINVIQNDFDRMLSDGYCTKQDIGNSIEEFKRDFEYNINKLKDLEFQVCELLWEKSR